MSVHRSIPCLLIAFVAIGCDSPTGPAAPDARPAASVSTPSSAAVAAAAHGSAHFETGGELRNVTFSAVRRADGTVEGEFQLVIHAFDAFWHTRVECLAVVGNRAFIGGTITSASDGRIQVGTKSYFWVEDHGGDGPDRVSIAGVNETPEGLADFCELRQNLLPGTDVLQGNVTVR